MSALGTPTRKPTTMEDLLRTVVNAILEEKVKNQGVKTQTPVVAVTLNEVIDLSDSTPTITLTTSATDTYDSATAFYDTSEWA